MPRIIVQAIEGRSLEQKRHVVRAITTGVVEALAVAPETVTVVIEEIPREHISKAGLLYSDRPGETADSTPADGRS